MWELAIFWVLAVVAVAGAVATVSFRGPIYCALSLIVSLFALAGLYVLLCAHFLAVMQVLVYVGAIMVLFVFVVMLLNVPSGALREARVTILSVLSGVVVLLLAGKFAKVLLAVTPAKAAAVPGAARWETFGTVGEVGRLLFAQFLLPFELTSVLLLVAVVGAVVVARKRFRRERP